MIDLCAGAGGKTLALAAAMENKGQIYATDTDKRRLAPIHERLERAGVRNVQVRTPRGATDALADLAGRADLVLIDAPCTGTGAWRRNPDAKWRVRPGALAERLKDQAEALDRAAPLVKSGRADRLRDLLGARRRERRAGRAISRAPSGLQSSRQPTSRTRSASAPSCFARGGAAVGGGLADDPAPHRHGRVFRQRAAEGLTGALNPRAQRPNPYVDRMKLALLALGAAMGIRLVYQNGVEGSFETRSTAKLQGAFLRSGIARHLNRL